MSETPPVACRLGTEVPPLGRNLSKLTGEKVKGPPFKGRKTCSMSNERQVHGLSSAACSVNVFKETTANMLFQQLLVLFCLMQ